MTQKTTLARAVRAMTIGGALLAALASQAAWAGAVQVGSRAALGAVVADADWGTLGGDQTSVGASPSVSPVSVTGASAFTVFEQGGAGSWSGNFAAGERVLSMFDLNVGPVGGVFDIALSSSASAIGMQIQALDFGAFSVDVSLYDAGNNLIDSFLGLAGTSNGDNDGSALFLGFVSDAVNIARMVISGAGDGAAINHVTLGDAIDGGGGGPVPEPSTLLMAALSIALLRATRVSRA
jgi:hypothetical protein